MSTFFEEAIFDDVVLPSSIVSYDLNNNEGTLKFVYDPDHRMFQMDTGAWCSVTEVVMRVNEKKLRGEWCAKHCSELDDILLVLMHQGHVKSGTLIWDGHEHNYMTLHDFIYFHSNKYILDCGVMHAIDRVNTSKNEPGVVVYDDTIKSNKVVDMFADGTAFVEVDVGLGLAYGCMEPEVEQEFLEPNMGVELNEDEWTLAEVPEDDDDIMYQLI